MRKTVLALIAGIGLLLLHISPISARTADMSLIGKPAAPQSMVVQAQMDEQSAATGSAGVSRASSAPSAIANAAAASGGTRTARAGDGWPSNDLLLCRSLD